MPYGNSSLSPSGFEAVQLAPLWPSEIAEQRLTRFIDQARSEACNVRLAQLMVDAMAERFYAESAIDCPF